MKIVALLILMYVNSSYCAPLPAQERYLQANTLYEQGEFAKAYEIYKGIQHKSPELTINMGNAAFELGKIPEALVRWRQAQRVIKKRDYDILEDRIEQIHATNSTHFASSQWHKLETRIELLMRVVPQKIWQALMLALCTLGLLVLGWYKKRQWFLIGVWAVLCALCVALLCIRSTVQDRLMAIALVNTHAYAIKDTDSRVKTVLKNNQEVIVIDLCDGWYLITNGTVSGWVKQNDIQLI